MQLKNRIERKIISLSDIKTDDSNPNMMNQKQEEALEASFEKFGYVYDIVIDKKTGIVADGEHRLKELLKRGIKEAEVKIIDFENDVERRIFRQVANKVRGIHDESKDMEEFKKILKEENMEELVRLTGQTEQNILNILNKEERPPKSETEELNKLYEIEIECPKCHHKFKKRRE